jgi:hypothetical protein
VNGDRGDPGTVVAIPVVLLVDGTGADLPGSAETLGRRGQGKRGQHDEAQRETER